MWEIKVKLSLKTANYGDNVDDFFENDFPKTKTFIVNDQFELFEEKVKLKEEYACFLIHNLDFQEFNRSKNIKLVSYNDSVFEVVAEEINQKRI